jgi:hypothetical protein
MRRKEVTTRYGETHPAPEWYSATGAPSRRCFLLFELRHTVCSQEATYLWTRERRRARDAEARFTRCAASRDWAALSGRVPGLSVHGICGRQSSRYVVRRHLSIGTRPKAKEAAVSCENFSWL